MRTALIALLLATPTGAEVMSFETCIEGIAEDPDAARQAAARWITLSGSTSARMCEAFALAAQGAIDTAATQLTELAQDTRAAMEPEQRAYIFATAGRLWGELGQGNLALQTYAAAADLAPSPDVLRTLAQLQALQEDWEGAQGTLDLLAPDPKDALLRARVFRGQGALDKALAQLQIDPLTPAQLLERAQIQAALGDRAAAIRDIAQAQALDSDKAYIAEIQALLRKL